MSASILNYYSDPSEICRFRPVDYKESMSATAFWASGWYAAETNAQVDPIQASLDAFSEAHNRMDKQTQIVAVVNRQDDPSRLYAVVVDVGSAFAAEWKNFRLYEYVCDDIAKTLKRSMLVPTLLVLGGVAVVGLIVWSRR